ncbi:hypothetical protein Barb6XT_01891 [Bacteroidales bacterium Barb6XT]|nr:hypothetical protein Barb6XT_01891 [Bacteroidales bacterium Barb6XT]
MKQVQYIVDSQGNKTSVIVPFQEWENLTAQYHKQQTKLKVLLGIRDGLTEIKQANQKGEKLQTLDDFLHESGY